LSIKRLKPGAAVVERHGGGEMKSEVSGTSRQPGASVTSSGSGGEDFALVGAGR